MFRVQIVVLGENATAEIIVSPPTRNHSFASLQLCDCAAWEGSKTTGGKNTQKKIKSPPLPATELRHIN